MKTIALLLMTATLASARIGETYQECVKRYGKPTVSGATDPENSLHIFGKSGFLIEISFTKNRAYVLSYVKTGKDLKFTEAELTNILKANGEKWSKTDQDDAEKAFETEDKQLIALYIKGRLQIFDLTKDVPKLENKSTEGL